MSNPAYSDLCTLTLLCRDGDGSPGVADVASHNLTKSADLEWEGDFLPVDPDLESVVVDVGYLLMRCSYGRRSM